MAKKPQTNGEKNDEPLTIRVNLLVNGSVYALDPLSKNRVKELFPEAEGLPKVFFGYDARTEFESRHAKLWELAGCLLTGLTLEQIEQLGGIKMYYPKDERVIWQWPEKIKK